MNAFAPAIELLKRIMCYQIKHLGGKVGKKWLNGLVKMYLNWVLD